MFFKGFSSAHFEFYVASNNVPTQPANISHMRFLTSCGGFTDKVVVVDTFRLGGHLTFIKVWGIVVASAKKFTTSTLLSHQRTLMDISSNTQKITMLPFNLKQVFQLIVEYYIFDLKKCILTNRIHSKRHVSYPFSYSGIKFIYYF